MAVSPKRTRVQAAEGAVSAHTPESKVSQWEPAPRLSDSQIDREEDGEQDVWPQYPL